MLNIKKVNQGFWINIWIQGYPSQSLHIFSIDLELTYGNLYLDPLEPLALLSLNIGLGLSFLLTCTKFHKTEFLPLVFIRSRFHLNSELNWHPLHSVPVSSSWDGNTPVYHEAACAHSYSFTPRVHLMQSIYPMAHFWRKARQTPGEHYSNYYELFRTSCVIPGGIFQAVMDILRVCRRSKR